MNLEGKRCLVTGAAGFIGSNLSEVLAKEGASVTGIDSFTDYYDVKIKRLFAKELASLPNFRMIEDDLNKAPLETILKEEDIVFHLAAQAGVRASWGEDFKLYVERNILATQKLLEALKKVKCRLVYASSSSAYGDAETLPTNETALRTPISPYGVTKSTCEDMIRVYGKSFGVDWTILRYFTVYGPRQRPDMAFHKLIRAALTGNSFPVFGDGTQMRDVTYVTDAAKATAAAGVMKEALGEIINIGGGRMTALKEVIDYVKTFAHPSFKLEYTETQKGDAKNTGADISKAQRILNYSPEVGWKLGINREREYISKLLKLGL